MRPSCLYERIGRTSQLTLQQNHFQGTLPTKQNVVTNTQQQQQQQHQHQHQQFHNSTIQQFNKNKNKFNNNKFNKKFNKNLKVTK
jgi:hypothetical protein